MNNKTFKSKNGTNRDLAVGTFQGDIHLVIEKGQGSLGITLSPALAPEIALAILEAAGVEIVPADSYSPGSLDQLRDATYELRRYVNAQAGMAKEAADWESLELEAFRLWGAFNPGTAYTSWSALPSGHREDFLRVAKAAREIHKAVS